MFCEREIARKDPRRIEMSFGFARFSFVRDLSGFDFEAQPSVDRGQVRDLATGRFIANVEAVLLLSPTEVGKTRLAVAIGREVIVAGYRALRPGHDVGRHLGQGACRGEAGGEAGAFRKAEAAHHRRSWLSADATHLFFQTVSRRHKRRALFVTSNRSIGKWGGIFGNAVVATVILDRMFHHSHVITIQGKSYRLPKKGWSGLLQKAAPAHPTINPSHSQRFLLPPGDHSLISLDTGP